MPFFGENYTLRRFGESKIINGYPTTSYEDMNVFLDVQESFQRKKTEEAGSRDELLVFASACNRTSGKYIKSACIFSCNNRVSFWCFIYVGIGQNRFICKEENKFYTNRTQ